MRPQTIENRWDLLYAQFPNVYDEFSSFPYHPDPVYVVVHEFSLAGKVVLDIGSGTGRSTLKLARHARQVIGVEPEPAMSAVAEQRLTTEGVTNVRLLRATKEQIPLPDASVDAVVSMTAGLDVAEAVRVVRPGGVVASVDVAPGHYGGDLDAVIAEPTPELELESRRLIEEFGFSVKEFDSVQEYGSTDNIVRTYGFIFGRRAIAHLQRTGRTSIIWRWRIHYRRREPLRTHLPCARSHLPTTRTA
jgi:ubiquinone/menaquinone biosynthesis C-methylase UbiE